MPQEEQQQKAPRKQLSTTEQFAALSRVGTALMSELSETQPLHIIAEAAFKLTGATLAAFTLQPVNKAGEPFVPLTRPIHHIS